MGPGVVGAIELVGLPVVPGAKVGLLVVGATEGVSVGEVVGDLVG